MSVAFLTVAFSARMGKSSLKSVLVALADRADDKTGLAFPSVADLIERTELDRKTVLSCIAELQQRQILIDTGKRTGRTNQVRVWWLDFAAIEKATQKRDASRDDKTVPKPERFQKRNGSGFPMKQSRFSAETVPKTGHGTPINHQINHHHQETVQNEICDLVAAAVWSFRKGGGNLRSEAGFRRSVRTRILAEGANHDDLCALADWRAAQARKTSHAAKVPPLSAGTDPAACAKGIKFFSAGFQERLPS